MEEETIAGHDRCLADVAVDLATGPGYTASMEVTGQCARQWVA